MKNIKITKFLIISILSVSIHATDYDNAKFDNFVSGQGVNEVLAEAQFIICSMAKMGTKELSGDGTYKATLYIQMNVNRLEQPLLIHLKAQQHHQAHRVHLLHLQLQLLVLIILQEKSIL